MSQTTTKKKKFLINWNQLTPIVSDNIILKQKITNLTNLPFHQIVRNFNQLSHKEIIILFHTGVLTNKILIRHSQSPGSSKDIYFAANSVQFFQRLLEKHLVAHDVMLLVETRYNEFVLKPIMYYNIPTLNYLFLKRQANPDVTDSDGCPSYLDNWKERDPHHLDVFKLHKLLTLGAKGIGVDRNGNNLLHFIASGSIPWGPMSNVLRYFLKREDLKTLVSQRNKDGLEPLHLLVRQALNDECTDKHIIIEIIEFILDLGADVNAPIHPSGLTILHLIVISYTGTRANTLPSWVTTLSPYLRNIPDRSGVTPLVLALHSKQKRIIEFIKTEISLSVRDTRCFHAYLISSNITLFHLYTKNNRISLFLRSKHGITCPFPSPEILSNGINNPSDEFVLALNNALSCSVLCSPWFLEYMETQMESLLIGTVNKSLDSNALCFFLHCYLETLNSEYKLPTGNVTEKNYLSDFNFQLSKHLTRVVRALGHLRFEFQINLFIDKFLSFLYKHLLPLLDRKLKPSDINAVKEGYIGHFIQDVVFQITLVLYMWYIQVNEREKEHAREVISEVWKRLIHGPNSDMSVLGMCVASITAWRVKICIEIKLDSTEILKLFKEMGTDFNARMLPSPLTPIGWILTNEHAGRVPAFLLLKRLYESGGYLYVRNQEGLNAIDLALKNSAQIYRAWGQAFSQIPKPLKTVCAESIVTNNISIRSFGRSKHLTEFVNLHRKNTENVLFVFKSGEICLSYQDIFYS